MKKGNLLLVCILMISILSISIISARGWSDFWDSFFESDERLGGELATLSGVADEDLIAYYEFENNLQDSSGRENHAANHGANFVDGKVGKALNFGVGDYADVGNWILRDDFTISLWVKIRSEDEYGSAFVSQDEGGGSKNKWIFLRPGSKGAPFKTKGRTAFHINNPGVGADWFYGNTWVPDLDTWYHIVLIKKGNTYTFYRNGVYDGFGISSVELPNVAHSLEIGKAEGVFKFDGLMDELKIWNRALSVMEVEREYESVSGGDGGGVSCEDSDGGDEIYKKGYRINYDSSYPDYLVEQWDYCMYRGQKVDSCYINNAYCYVNEYHCKTDLFDTSNSFKCSNGCKDGVCIKMVDEICLDGTKHGECSTDKPKYCQEEILVSKCDLCGCSNSEICLNDGSCQDYNPNKKTISIFIDKSIYNSLTLEINRFRQDIINDWDVNVFIFYNSWANEEDIRSILKNIYEDFKLSGVIFIGEVPYRLITNSPTGDYPSDAFYKDFYNECDYDPNGNIISDSLWTKCFFGDPWNYNEFWIGRIKPPVSGEEGRDLLKSYFNRNHEYRIGNKEYSEDMLAYLEILEDPLTDGENIIEGFLESIELGQLFTRNQIKLLTPKQNQGYNNCSMDITYLNEMKNNSYKYVFLNAHGSPEIHMCNILGDDIKTNPPNAMFYEFRSCSVGDYSKENYMAGLYVFSGEGLIANAASTIIYGSTVVDVPFSKFLARGLSFGESWLLSGSGLHSQIGDPTLKFERVINSNAEIQLNLTKIDFRDIEICNFSDFGNCNKKFVYVDIKNIGSGNLILEGGLAIYTKYKYSEWALETIGSEIETFFNLGSYSEIIIKPGEKITASVYFLPSLPGEYSGSYFIMSNSKENPVLEIPFTVNKLEEVKKEIVIQNIEDCQGCFLEDSCIPYTIRSKEKYCSLDGNMIDQKSSKESCENNFECKSNVCVNSECISEGLLKKILNWFRKLFGGK